MICPYLSVSLSNSRMLFVLNNFMCVKPKIIEHFNYLKSIVFFRACRRTYKNTKEVWTTSTRLEKSW